VTGTATRAAKAAGTGEPGPFFIIRPAKEQDFVEGGRPVLGTFRDSKEARRGNMARPLSGIDFLTEGKHVHRGTAWSRASWTYHIDRVTTDITRTKAEANAACRLSGFSWQHERTVLNRSPWNR